MAAGNTTKVKIRVADMIARVEEVKAEDETRFATQKAEYDAAMAVWPDEVKKAVEAVAKAPDLTKVEDDGAYSYRAGGYSTTINIVVPRRPTAPIQTENHDKALRMLKMVSDTEMIITLGDDLARYL